MKKNDLGQPPDPAEVDATRVDALPSASGATGFPELTGQNLKAVAVPVAPPRPAPPPGATAAQFAHPAAPGATAPQFRAPVAVQPPPPAWRQAEPANTAATPAAAAPPKRTVSGEHTFVCGPAQPAPVAVAEPTFVKPATNPGAELQRQKATGEFEGEHTARRPVTQPSSATPAPASKTGPSGNSWGNNQAGFSAPQHEARGLPEEGARIQHYELIRLIGKGGMGSVYLGRDTRLGRKVAVKFLHTDSADLAQRFVLEARTTAQCSHENIVSIYDVGEFGGNPFMVLEFLQGKPLSKLIPDGKPMPPARVVELLVPVARALERAHEEGIVHRDLKPDNIFVTDSGAIKVLDFGIAKVLQAGAAGQGDETSPVISRADVEAAATRQGTAELTAKGMLVGTLAYMSPEQWGNGVAIDHRTDIWALGIMLFRMLSGKHPLAHLNGPQLMVTGVIDEPMPKLASFAPDVPKELCAIVDRCLLKKKDERFADARALLTALEGHLPGRHLRELKVDESPYAGLSSFQEDDADRFFGRNHEIAAMVNRLRDRPLLGIVGPSGAGKSSFVRAGLVPALKRSGEPWESLVIRPGRTPLQSLAAIIAPMVSTSTTVSDDLQTQNGLAAQLAREPGYLGAVLRSRARRQKKNLLLFIDQFEELYTLVSNVEERKAFTACITGLADDPGSPLRVVLSIRSDFLDRASEDPRFMAELGQALIFVNAPGREGLRDAIALPAEMAGFRFENPKIVDDMLDHLAATSGALPLLQFAASKLWELRDVSSKQLTQKSYESIGGIAGALASHADATLGKVPQSARASVKAIFLRLVTPDKTRAIVSMEELRELSKNGQELQSVVEQLVQARLLVVQTGGAGGGTVEIVHESLIHSWPTLKRWLEETGEDAVFLDQLRQASRQWVAKNKDAGLLWRGESVDEARRFMRRFKGDLPEQQQQFLDAVFALETRGARLKRIAAISGVGFLLFLIVAAGIALINISEAKEEALEAKEEAVEQANKAKAAEAEAKANAAAAMAKEQERRAAAERAEQESIKALAAAAEIKTKNEQLNIEMAKVSAAEAQARRAQFNAEQKAIDARLAREEAQRSMREVIAKRQEELKRLEEMEKQLGSSVVETLR